ncbi:MAG TPA: SRPBCC domain-containing protein, partial [Trebonia sp.]|nr:SRPBCC domain-containing protein [Trebonia sp.]
MELLNVRPQRAGELAAAFDVSAPAVSRHLKVLRRSGLATDHGVDDDARLRVYELRQEPFTALQAWLDQVQAFWTGQLGAFREHVENISQGTAYPLLERLRAGTGEGFEIGRVLAWEPGKRLVFTWRQGNWALSEFTEVEVRYRPTGSGTRVTVEHGGWDRVPAADPGMTDGYGHGWQELLGFYAQA